MLPPIRTLSFEYAGSFKNQHQILVTFTAISAHFPRPKEPVENIEDMPAARKSPFENGACAKAAKDDEDEDAPAGAGDDSEEGGSREQPAWKPDPAETSGFVNFFHGMETPPEHTVRFFHRKKEGEFYSCHGDDAVYIAQECFHTMSVVKYMGKNNELASVTVSTANFNSFASQLLTERQYRIEVWGENKVRCRAFCRTPGASSWDEQLGGASRAGARAERTRAQQMRKKFALLVVLTNEEHHRQGKNTWSIIRQGSPGNLESFEDIVFDAGGEAQDTPTACCVQVTQGDAGWKVRGRVASVRSLVLFTVCGVKRQEILRGCAMVDACS